MNQNTIKNVVSIQGISLYSGTDTTIKLSPSDINKGVRFFTENRKIINISSDAIIDTTLSTNISNVNTIEHLMSALHALHIDNVNITINGDSVPILDGSSEPFYNLLLSAGIEKQNEPRKFVKVKKRIVIRDNEKYITIDPYDGLIIDMSIKFGHPKIGTQRYVFDLYNDDYQKNISPARTFGFLKDYDNISSIIKGVSFDNTIVLDGDDVINTDLRFKNEFIRHKLLDFIGDIYTDGPILGKIHACCCGHTLNNKVMRILKDR